MPELNINGCQIWCEVEGTGDYVLQIGGAGFAHENFGMVTADFKKRFTVIDFDLRGYGLSGRPMQEYSMDVWADDVAAMLDALGIAKTHVHGSSMGGMVAIKLAAKYPEKVDGLVIGCSSAKSDSMSRARWEVWKALARAYGMDSQALAFELATQALSRSFLDSERGPVVVEAIRGVLGRNCSVEVFCAACDAMVDMDLTGDLPQITAPTLVMAGALDILTPITQGPRGAGSDVIAKLIPNAELRIIDGVAHTNLMEVPELSVEIVSEFLDRVSTQKLNASAR